MPDEPQIVPTTLETSDPYLVPGYLATDDYLSEQVYYDDPYWEGFTAQAMVHVVRRRLGMSPTDENRYPTESVVHALNIGAVRFAKMTLCLQHQVVVIGQANRMTYPVPFGSLRILAARYYTGNNQQDYYELNVIRSTREMQRKDSEFRGNAGQPEWLFPVKRAGRVPFFGTSPYPSVDGVVFQQITGQHTADPNYLNSPSLVDAAGRDLVAMGATINNPSVNIQQQQIGLFTLQAPNGNLYTISAMDTQGLLVTPGSAGNPQAAFYLGTWEITVNNYGALLVTLTGTQAPLNNWFMSSPHGNLYSLTISNTGAIIITEISVGTQYAVPTASLIYNLTKRVAAPIITVQNALKTNDQVIAMLPAGLTWAAGDQFAISLSPSGILLGADGQMHPLCSEWGSLDTVIGNAGNFILDIARKPIPFYLNSSKMLADPEQTSQIPVEYQEAVVSFAEYWLGSQNFGGVVQMQKATAALAVFNAYVDEWKNGTDLVEVSNQEIEAVPWWE